MRHSIKNESPSATVAQHLGLELREKNLIEKERLSFRSYMVSRCPKTSRGWTLKESAAVRFETSRVIRPGKKREDRREKSLSVVNRHDRIESRMTARIRRKARKKEEARRRKEKKKKKKMTQRERTHGT